VNAAFKVHKELGPGLLEKVCEVCVAHELRKEGYNVKRQLDIRTKIRFISERSGHCGIKSNRVNQSCLGSTNH